MFVFRRDHLECVLVFENLETSACYIYECQLKIRSRNMKWRSWSLMGINMFFFHHIRVSLFCSHWSKLGVHSHYDLEYLFLTTAWVLLIPLEGISNGICNMQDSLSRLHERGKENSKSLKQLTKLFPNNVTIQIPQVLWPNFI